MSIDQVPAQVADTTDRGNYANPGGKLQADSAQTANVKSDNSEKNVALVQSGVLPSIVLHENERPAHRGEDRKNEEGRHHGEGEHGHGQHGQGMHHGFHRPGGMAEERLHRSEFKKLSPDDKEKFKAEDGAAREYHKEMADWRKSGKTGPAPNKPDLPEHEKLAAKVKADREAIVKGVRGTMTPEELAAVDQARTQFKQQVEAAGSRKGLPLPQELRDYDKRIIGATRDYLKGQS
jgi:hypothetical protein